MIGRYATSLGFFDVIEKRGELHTTAMGLRFVFAPSHAGWFYPQLNLLGFIRRDVEDFKDFYLTVRTIDGRKVVLMNSRGQISAGGEVVTPVPIPDVWKRRTGAYRPILEYPDKEKEYIYPSDTVLYIENDLLFFGMFGRKSALEVLVPENDTEAIMAGLGRGARETVFMRTIDGREILDYKGQLFERVDD